MLRSRLDLNLLVTLKVLLDECNVTRAAEVVGVTQPAMSASLARLRDHFGDPLIVPVGRRMERTPLADGLLESLGDTLSRIHATLATEARFDAATSRRAFSILASDYVASVLLPGALRHAEAEAPGVRVRLLPPGDRAAALLDDGEVDLLVVPTRFASERQEARPLFDEGYSVVCDAQRGDAATAPDPLPFERYLQLGHAVFDRSDYEAWFAQRHGETRRVELVVNSFWQLAHVLVGSGRIAAMPTRMARAAARELPLRLVRPAFDTPTFSVVLQSHRSRDGDPGIGWLRALIEAEAASLRPAPRR